MFSQKKIPDAGTLCVSVFKLHGDLRNGIGVSGVKSDEQTGS